MAFGLGVAVQARRWGGLAGWRAGQWHGCPFRYPPYLATGITSEHATKQDLQVPLGLEFLFMGSLEALLFESFLAFYTPSRPLSSSTTTANCSSHWCSFQKDAIL